jgi:CTP synthase (UTP-ammonia lyase)
MIRLGIIGDFDEGKPSHRATNEALDHCACTLGMDVSVEWLPTPDMEGKDIDGYDAFFGAPGSPYRSIKGAIDAIRFARENDYPYLGTCGGCQHAVMEYARNALRMADVRHQEYDPDAPDCVVSALSCSIAGETGTIYLKKDSLIRKAYGRDEIAERYTCHFGLNSTYRDAFERSGFCVTGTDSAGEARVFEIPQNRFYIATLFQPQLSSTPENPNPLITAYLRTAHRFHAETGTL